ncbi:hypothetical protein EAG_13163 [Camponotus floridanus]|uniref:Uncharacterized protein n=1 Tax=Camponotus floridanus TaxID=104421 RepID=E2AE19_CAMFO|nr:hypothetical protein EAG_13163 [Camponotus floridanus]
MSDWRDLFLGTMRSAALTNRRGGKNMLTTRKARGGNEYRKSAPIQITKKKGNIRTGCLYSLSIYTRVHILNEKSKCKDTNFEENQISTNANCGPLCRERTFFAKLSKMRALRSFGFTRQLEVLLARKFSKVRRDEQTRFAETSTESIPELLRGPYRNSNDGTRNSPSRTATASATTSAVTRRPPRARSPSAISARDRPRATLSKGLADRDDRGATSGEGAAERGHGKERGQAAAYEDDTFLVLRPIIDEKREESPVGTV